MKKSKRAMLVLIACLAASAAFAGALTNKKIGAQFLAGNQDDLTSTNTACGSKIKLEIPMDKYDQKLWGQNDDGGGGYAPPCGIIMEGVRSVCAKSDDFKKAVAGKLKTIVCQPTSAKQGTVAMSGSKLVFAAGDPNVGNNPSADATAQAVTAAVDK